MKKKLLLLLLTSLFLFSCSSKNTNTRSRLIVGTDASFPPFEYIIDENFVGFDVELAKEIAKIQNKNIRIVNIPFDMLFSALKNGDIDMAISGITITDERKRIVDFSDTYYEASQTVLIREGDKRFEHITTKEQLAEIPKIAVQLATTSSKIAHSYCSENQIVESLSANIVFDELINENVDAIIIDREPAKLFIEKHNNVKILPIKFEFEYYGIAVAKNNKELLNSINEAINETVRSGNYHKLIEYNINSYSKK